MYPNNASFVLRNTNFLLSVTVRNNIFSIYTCFTVVSHVALYTRTSERINAIDTSPVVSARVAMAFVYVWKHNNDTFYVSPMLSRGWAKASACCFQICLSFSILCQLVPFQKSFSLSLQRLAGLPLDVFLS